MPRNYYSSRFNVMYGSEENQGLIGTSTDDYMIGHRGSDFMLGGFGNDTMRGGAGNDYLNGGDGNDVLIGGSGADIMLGGAGNDRLALDDGDIATGGADADTFHFNVGKGGTVRITDFDASEDMLRLRNTKDLTWTTEQELNHTEITFSNGAVLELFGVSEVEILEDPGLFGL